MSCQMLMSFWDEDAPTKGAHAKAGVRPWGKPSILKALLTRA